MSFEDYETELLESLTVPVNGLPSEFDSDEGLIPMAMNGETSDNPNIEIGVNEDPTSDAQVPQIIIDEAHVDPSETEESIVPGLLQVCSKDGGEGSSTGVNSNIKWTGWSPAQLKTKKHPLLNQKKAKGHCTKDQLNVKVENVVNSRHNLVELQKKYLENEELRRVEEHELKMAIQKQKLAALDLEIEREQKLYLKKMELLECELSIKKKTLELLEK
ncbi:hypothetical protein Zmor_005279 [Zophobas morio]|uniref:Uncharacterized protein n=1 Tax=Zophobas morio TaxID=2755281 RepID=A0AA38MLS7_9CUCU|nr:hypothetical protein Zmor_005279 [Zophobas morio]